MRPTRVAVIALLSLLFLPLAVQSTSIAYADGSDVNYWAVVVGVANYPGLINDLSYTDDDALDFAHQLSPIWGEDHVKLLLNSEATKLNVKDAMCSWLDERADANDVVLFYYSGHGESNYLCPYDTSARSYGNDISTSELTGWLDQLESQSVVVILDTCNSSSFTGTLSKNGRVILTSSDSDESSWEVKKLLHGVFTNYLLEAIDHYTDADINRDYELSVEEIFTYASPKTSGYEEEEFGEFQNPQILDRYEGNLGLFYWSTIDMNPHSALLSMTIDGHEYSCTELPVSFKWVPDSVHSVGINSSSSDWISMPSQTISQGGEYNPVYLTVKSDYGDPQGEGWYFEGTPASISITSPQGIIIRNVFTSWSGDATVTTSNATLLMDRSKTVTAEWHKDYTQLYILVAGLLGIAVIVAIFVRFIFVKKRRLAVVAFDAVHDVKVEQDTVPVISTADDLNKGSGFSTRVVSYCPNCGAKVGEIANFCKGCGCNLMTEETGKNRPHMSIANMKCATHTSRGAISVCGICGNGVCDLCQTVSGDKIYCPSCFGKALNRPM